jgi:hypothetical protein
MVYFPLLKQQDKEVQNIVEEAKQLQKDKGFRINR